MKNAVKILSTLKWCLVVPFFCSMFAAGNESVASADEGVIILPLLEASAIQHSIIDSINHEDCNSIVIYDIDTSNNKAPILETDYISVNAGSSALKNILENDVAIDSELDASTLVISQKPTKGRVTVARGEVIYSSTENETGTDEFVYQICDLKGNCNEAKVIVAIASDELDPCDQANQFQEFYLPFPEEDLYAAFRNSSCDGGALHTENVRSVISIKTPYPTIFIKYDHWEDGYEEDLTWPTQASTEIWGDGNLTNGIAPGYPDDILLAGSSVIIDNTFNYEPPRDPSMIVYDGKDKVVSSSDITISKINGDQPLFLYQAAKTTIYDTDRFGTSFTIPFGENFGREFQYTALYIRASEDNTVVTVDVDADGIIDANDHYAILNEGEVFFVEGDPNYVNNVNDIKSGTIVTASKKVGLDVLFGGLDCYGTRNVDLQPATFYSNTYYTPVPTRSSVAPAVIYFYNEHNYPLTINWQGNFGMGAFQIQANSPLGIRLPQIDTGYKFENQDGEPFIAMQVIDADNDGAGFDWAFDLIGVEQLSDFASIAWAPGSWDLSRNDGPIWVTPTANTTLYIKLDGDVTANGPNISPCGRSYDFAQQIDEFDIYRVLDNSDNDQSGVALYTCDGTTFFSVYGEDPGTAIASGPSLDVGTTMAPLCSERLILANEDIAFTPIGIPIDIPVLDNDGSFLATIDPNKLYTNGLLQPSSGTLYIDPITHRIVYTPNLSFEGMDYFEYQICSLEDDNLCDIAMVTVVVGDCNANDITVVASGFTYFESLPDNGNYDGEPIIQNIDVNLYWDENGNGIIEPPLDTLVLSTTSNISGYYEFNFRILGSFVIEVDENNGGFEPGTLNTASISFSSLNACETELYLGLSPILDPVDDSFTTFLNTSLSENLIENDIGDIDATTISFGSIFTENGTVSFDDDGSFEYVPNLDFIGADSFEYMVCSNFDPDFCKTAMVSIEVLCPASENLNIISGTVFNDADADGQFNNADSGIGSENILLYIDADQDGILGASDVLVDSTLTNADGSYFFLTDPMDYILIFDETSLEGVTLTTDNIETVHFSSIGQSECLNNFGLRRCFDACPPKANDDYAFTIIDQAVTINVLTNDTDPNNDIDPTSVLIPPNSTISNGDLTINPDGSITYDPYAFFSGTDTFYYQICDQSSPTVQCDIASVFVYVGCADSPNGNLISGFVFNDVNADTNQNLNENGAGNVSVMLYEDVNQNGVLDEDDILIETTNSDGNGYYEFLRPPTYSTQYLSYDINAGQNDGYENLTTGDVRLNTTALVFGLRSGQNRLIGFNFNNINIPQNTLIQNAYLEFYARGNFTADASCEIYGEAADNAALFEEIDFNMTSRTPTNSLIEWNDIEPWYDNNFYQTPDISAIVQEVISRPGWNPGGNMSFFVERITGRRRAEAFESSGGPPAKLVIEYAETSLGATHYITVVDVNSLPEGATMLTDSIENTEFTHLYQSDCGNNFGFNSPSQNLLAISDINATELNIPVAGNVLTNDQGENGFEIESQVFNVFGGSVVLEENGDYIFTPTQNYSGESYFEYQICDSIFTEICDTAIVTIDIIDCISNNNNQVIGIEDHYIHENHTDLFSNLLVNDFDPQGDILQITTIPIIHPDKGILTINNNGSFLYQPNSDATGVDAFVYEVCDDGVTQSCDTVNVSIFLLSGNLENNIYATDDAFATTIETLISGNIILNDNLSNISDFYVETLPVLAPENGDLIINPTGSFEYVPHESFVGNDRFIYKVCDTNYPLSCDSATVYLTILDDRIRLDFRVMLQGALYGNSDSLMRTDLVQQNLVPLQQPYSPSFNPLFSNRLTHVSGGNETTTNAILNANQGTPDAIVDWVFIELRDPVDSTTVIKSISALVQSDGDIVDAESGGNLYVKDIIGQFFVCIKHRNHLGAMTASPIVVDGKIAIADFTTMEANDLFHFEGYDGLAQTSLNGFNALWAGNANADSKIKYDGSLNDRIILVGEIIATPDNFDSNLNYNNAIGYHQGDINLDGKAKYDGILNDRLVIQYILLTYPKNANLLNNYNQLIEQIK